MYTIGTRASAKDGGGMCMGGDADYSIANIMILTVEKRGAHKEKAGSGCTKRALTLAYIG